MLDILRCDGKMFQVVFFCWTYCNVERCYLWTFLFFFCSPLLGVGAHEERRREECYVLERRGGGKKIGGERWYKQQQQRKKKVANAEWRHNFFLRILSPFNIFKSREKANTDHLERKKVAKCGVETQFLRISCLCDLHSTSRKKSRRKANTDHLVEQKVANAEWRRDFFFFFGEFCVRATSTQHLWKSQRSQHRPLETE